MEEHSFSPDPAAVAAHTFLLPPQGLEEMTQCKVPLVGSAETLPAG